MTTELYCTYFVHVNGDKLGSASGLLPISLYKKMQITIHGQKEKFSVVDWSFHHGHADENSGLTIILD